MENINVLSIIIIAILGSFGHCVGMCGGIIVAYSSTKIKEEWSKKTQVVAHLLYSFGRITTYTFIGLIMGFLGDIITFSLFTNTILLFITGLMMIFVGLSLLGKIKFLVFLEHSCSKSKIYQKSFKKLLGKDSLISFYFLGTLNGFLPCGFVYAFAIIAAGTASPIGGALTMFIFGLCTMPALFSLGFFIGLFNQSQLRGLFLKIASVLVILFGFYMIYLSYNYYLDPNNINYSLSF